MEFDIRYWQKRIREPHWYKDIPNLLKELSVYHNSDREGYEKMKEKVLAFFEENLYHEEIILGDKVGLFDKERKTIDTIVIHHTSNLPGMSNERLSAMQLVRLYAPAFANTDPEGDRFQRGDLVCSGHVRKGKQVFYPYHWIVRKNGKTERLLLDEEVGWHAGDWEVNCRSIAIVFDGDFEDTTPSEIEMKACAELIQGEYPQVKADRVYGHREINAKTTCPSKLWSSWKKEIINKI